MGVDHLARGHLKLALFLPVSTVDVAAIKSNHDGFGGLRPGAGLRLIAEPVVDTISDFAELVLAAKLERRRIMERTARGRADAKAKGVQFGRKPILTPHQRKEARKRVEEGEPQRSVARSYNVSQATISRLAG
jgi:DNA invertase Pin-like site-specific DNA recombinase